MSKENTNIIKGIAILFMLWLHLFNRMSNVELCETFIYIDGIPLVNILTKATNPVAFFLIVSGYGLYLANRRGDSNRIKRLITLLIHYWVVMGCFVSVGHYLHPSVYPASLMNFVENFTSYHTTYNGEMWFLGPYIILSLFAPFYFKLINCLRGGVIVIILLSYVLYLGQSWILGHFSELIARHYWILVILNLFQLQFNFTLGAVAAKENIFGRIKDFCVRHFSLRIVSIIASLGLACLVWFQCAYGTALYAFAFIALINIIKIPQILSQLLQGLGKRSMDIWFIHTWICYYLFHDFIYGFRFPIVIFAVLLIISYVLAIGTEKVCKPIEAFIHDKVKPII